MAKVSPQQINFSAGEVSPLLSARTDAERYKSGLARCRNYASLLQGAITRRPGMVYCNTVKTPANYTKLIPFEFSVTQAYVLEFGNNYMRVYKNRARVDTTPGTAFELATPYSAAQVGQLKYVQSADTLYLVHPAFPPKKLLRLGDTSWSLVDLALQDGPYNLLNQAAITLTPSSTTGTCLITSGPVRSISGISNASGFCLISFTGVDFKVGDKVDMFGVAVTPFLYTGAFDKANMTVTAVPTVGQIIVNVPYPTGASYNGSGSLRPHLDDSFQNTWIRIFNGGRWGWAKTGQFASGLPAYQYQIAATIFSDFGSTDASTTWRIGFINSTNTQYPSCVTFHEDRLCFAGYGAAPQRVDCSKTGNYELFSPTATDGTVTADSALTFTLQSKDINTIRFLISDAKGLFCGTFGGEWIVRASSLGEALTATNISAKRSTKYGCADVIPVEAGTATIFMQKDLRKVRELVFTADADGFTATDISIPSEHITRTGIVDMAFQKSPYPIAWMVRSDGRLVGMTYEREAGGSTIGFHLHTLGGVCDALGNPAAVESVASITAPDGVGSDLYAVVRRYINGAVTRYIEYLGSFFQDGDLIQYANFLDCGALYDNPLAITAITAANPAVVTAPAHGFANGDVAQIDSVYGMTPLNGKKFTIAGVTTDTFQLVGVDSTGYPAYIAGGFVRKGVSTISGLSFLEGQSVSVLADGGTQANQVVTGGSITLPIKSVVVRVGLNFNSDGQQLRIEGGATDGTSFNKTRRINKVGIYLNNTVGLKFGASFDRLDTLEFRRNSDPLDSPVPLYSGIKSETVEFDYDKENQFCFRQDVPLPSTILAIYPSMVTQDD